MDRFKNKKFSGYSILEILIALFIFFVMLLLYGAASNTMALNRNTKNQDLALRIAASSIEDLRNTNFNSLPASGPLSHPLLGLLPQSDLRLTMTDLESKLKMATVVLTWKEASAQTGRTVTLTTYLTDKGL